MQWRVILVRNPIIPWIRNSKVNLAWLWRTFQKCIQMCCQHLPTSNPLYAILYPCFVRHPAQPRLPRVCGPPTKRTCCKPGDGDGYWWLKKHGRKVTFLCHQRCYCDQQGQPNTRRCNHHHLKTAEDRRKAIPQKCHDSWFYPCAYPTILWMDLDGVCWNCRNGMTLVWPTYTNLGLRRGHQTICLGFRMRSMFATSFSCDRAVHAHGKSDPRRERKGRLQFDLDEGMAQEKTRFSCVFFGDAACQIEKKSRSILDIITRKSTWHGSLSQPSPGSGSPGSPGTRTFNSSLTATTCCHIAICQDGVEIEIDD